MKIIYKTFDEVLNNARQYCRSEKHRIYLISEGLGYMYHDYPKLMKRAVYTVERQYRLESRPRGDEQYCQDIISRYKRLVFRLERRQKQKQHDEERRKLYDQVSHKEY